MVYKSSEASWDDLSPILIRTEFLVMGELTAFSKNTSKCLACSTYPFDPWSNLFIERNRAIRLCYLFVLLVKKFKIDGNDVKYTTFDTLQVPILTKSLKWVHNRNVEEQERSKNAFIIYLLNKYLRFIDINNNFYSFLFNYYKFP